MSVEVLQERRLLGTALSNISINKPNWTKSAAGMTDELLMSLLLHNIEPDRVGCIHTRCRRKMKWSNVKVVQKWNRAFVTDSGCGRSPRTGEEFVFRDVPDSCWRDVTGDITTLRGSRDVTKFQFDCFFHYQIFLLCNEAPRESPKHLIVREKEMEEKGKPIRQSCHPKLRHLSTRLRRRRKLKKRRKMKEHN